MRGRLMMDQSYKKPILSDRTGHELSTATLHPLIYKHFLRWRWNVNRGENRWKQNVSSHCMKNCAAVMACDDCVCINANTVHRSWPQFFYSYLTQPYPSLNVIQRGWRGVPLMVLDYCCQIFYGSQERSCPSDNFSVVFSRKLVNIIIIKDNKRRFLVIKR